MQKTKKWSTQKNQTIRESEDCSFSRLEAFYRFWNSLRNTKIFSFFSIVYFFNFLLLTETHIQIQVALHDCLPRSSLLGDGDTPSEIVYGEEKYVLYWVDQSSKGRINY